MSAAYRCCDVVVDLGPCMRRRLEAYGGSPARETLTPWALVEPEAPAAPDPAVRRELFGDAAIGLLYAGSMSRLARLRQPARARARVPGARRRSDRALLRLHGNEPARAEGGRAPRRHERALRRLRRRGGDPAPVRGGRLSPRAACAPTSPASSSRRSSSPRWRRRGRSSSRARRTRPSRAGSESTASGWCWSQGAPPTWRRSWRRWPTIRPGCTRCATSPSRPTAATSRSASINDRWAELLARQLRRPA